MAKKKVNVVIKKGSTSSAKSAPLNPLAFGGTLNRLRFFCLSLAVFGGMLGLGMLADQAAKQAHSGMRDLWSLALVIAVAWISIAAVARRMRDIGWSPGWLVGFLIPVGNILLFLYLLFCPSKKMARART